MLLEAGESAGMEIETSWDDYFGVLSVFSDVIVPTLCLGCCAGVGGRRGFRGWLGGGGRGMFGSGAVGCWNYTCMIRMWTPLTYIQINYYSRSTNQNTGRPSNVALIGTISNTHQSR